MSRVRQRPGSTPHGRVLSAFVLSLLIAAGAAVFIYVKYLRYERRAALHLPPSTTLAVRCDLEKVVLFEPFRKHLLGVANELTLPKKKGLSESPAEGRLERIKRHTGIELALDIRELVLAQGHDKESFVIAVGGLFPKSGVLAGLARALKQEAALVSLASDQQELLIGDRLIVLQAEDGTILLGQDREFLREARRRHGTYRTLKLALDDAAAFSIATPAIDPSSIDGSGRPRSREPALIHGTLAASTLVEVTAWFEPANNDRSVSPERAQKLVLGLLERAGLDRASSGSEEPPRMRFSSADGGTVRLKAWLSREQLDRASRRLARSVRQIVEGER